jgi:hypothetical protein
MSYSDLIQKDNPTAVWSLNEDPFVSLVISPDRFLYSSGAGNSFYTGTYSSSSINAVPMPIVYGGKQSIKLETGQFFTIPSLDKMSIKDSRNSSSLEFWVKVNTTSSTEQILVRKKDADSDQADDYVTAIYLKNDYVVFRLGKIGRYYEVSCPIDSINKPLHIVAEYSPSSISLIVNGVSKTKSISDPDSLFPAYDSGDEFFYFEKPAGIANVQFDCVSLYSYSLPRERALKHFVYGCGYSIPAEFINNNSGVSYNFSMDSQQSLTRYDMGPGAGWSITDADNCLIQNGSLTIKQKQIPETFFAENYNIADSSLFTSSGYSFKEGSYLQIENINSIIPDSLGGWALKFDTSLTAPSSGKKVLMSIGSKRSNNYIEFYVDSNSDLKVSSSLEATPKTLFTNLPSENFYIGYYKVLNGTSKAFYLPVTAGSAITSTIILPDIAAAYLRIGSEALWFDSDNISESASSKIVSNANLLKIVGIHADNSTLLDTYDEIEGGSFIHYYTATPNKEERRFKIKSYGYSKIDVDQQSLCPPLSETTGACRVEIGAPLGSETVKMTLKEKAFSSGTQTSSTTIYTNDYTNRVITSGSWLNKKVTQAENATTNPVDTLSFEFFLNTDDLVDQPPYLNYFRLFSYNLEFDGTNYYVNNNSSQGGNPAKIYLRSNECNIPDLVEMPFFYNGFSSGLKLKDSYAKINHNFTGVKKYSPITNIVVSGGNATYTLSGNRFVSGDSVSVSEINGTNQFAFLQKTISSVSGNNVVFTGFAPTGTYTADSDITDGTAGIMQSASGISTVSFMCYIPTGTDVSNNVLKIGSLQLSINSSTGQMSTVTGATRYVNGSTSSLAKLDQWQMISLVFADPVVINSSNPTEIILGSATGIANEVYVDQLMIFDKKLTVDDLLVNLYNLIVGETLLDYKVIASSKFKLRDTNNETLDNFNVIDIDYYIPSTTGGNLYNALSGGASPVNYSVVYAISSGQPTFEKTTVNQSDALNTLFVSNSQYIVAGSKLVSIDGVDLTTSIAVSSVENFNDYSKITLATNMSAKVNANKTLIFEDLNYSNNSVNNSKLKIGTKYIEQGDLILINNGTSYFLYQVTTLDPEAKFLYNATAITYTAVLTKVSGASGYKYNYGSTYFDIASGAVSVSDRTRLSFSDKISSKIQPQYLPTEQ